MSIERSPPGLHLAVQCRDLGFVIAKLVDLHILVSEFSALELLNPSNDENVAEVELPSNGFEAAPHRLDRLSHNLRGHPVVHVKANEEKLEVNRTFNHLFKRI